MMLHHEKHHKAYVTNLNVAEEKMKCALEKGDITTAISLEPALRFNGGGHINHTIFWKNLTPDQCAPSAELCKAIANSFGSFDKMKEQLAAASVGVMGSGWGWLAYCPKTGKFLLPGIYAYFHSMFQVV